MTAAIYARVSQRDQACDVQLAALREYARKQDLITYKEYVDHGVSGKKANRPALDKMLADAKARRFDVVLVYKLDRLGRSVLNLAQLIEQFDALKIRVIATEQGLEFDPRNPISRLLFTMLSAVAEFERALIIERTAAGVAHAKSNGKQLGRPEIVFDRVRAVEMLESGESYRQVARALKVSASTLRGTLLREGLIATLAIANRDEATA